MGNRGIGRARVFLGAILLLAAAMTWIIILMMSPHGPASVHGTQHLRSTIVTLKRNAAIGTLVLCALGGWLVPRRAQTACPGHKFGCLDRFSCGQQFIYAGLE